MTRVADETLASHPLMPRLDTLVAERYRIVGILGEGGFSVVYLARDELAGGKVALKVLAPNKSRNPAFVERFSREVRIVRELKHHNTIKIFDTGTTDTGCLFMVIEQVVGETLKELLEREGTLPGPRVFRISQQILSSLAEAHQRGVIHRDLKPANVMVCDLAGERDYVKVLDFGVAKAEIIAESQLVTGPSELMVTPQYAAPEVLKNQPVTPAADVYSLGLLLLEMLTGQPAVRGKTVWDLLARQVGPNPVEIPAEMASHPFRPLIERAVSKDPARRFRDAQEMLDGLSSVDRTRLSQAVFSLRTTGRKGRLSFGVGEQARSEPTARSWYERRKGRPARPSEEGRAIGVGRFRLPWGTLGWSVLVIGLLAAAVGLGIWLGEFGREGGSSMEISPLPPESPGGTTAPTTRSAQQRCEEGEYSVCLDLAMESAAGERPASQEAAAFLLTACEEGRIARACLELSSWYREGRHLAADPGAAIHYLAEGCLAGDLDICVHAGLGYLDVEGGLFDPVRARPLLQLGCDGGRSMACAGLGILYASGWGVQQDLETAIRLYGVACQANVLEACTRQGLLLSEGEGIDRDYEEARRLFERSCGQGDWEGCVGVARLYHRGLGVEVNGQRAHEFYERACLGGAVMGCTGLGSLWEQGLGVERDLERSRLYYRQGCSLGGSVACFNLGQLLERSGGDPGAAEEMAEAFRRACELGHQRACERIGEP